MSAPQLTKIAQREYSKNGGGRFLPMSEKKHKAGDGAQGDS